MNLGKTIKIIILVLIIIALIFGIKHFFQNKKRAENEEFIGSIEKAFTDVIESKNYTYGELTIRDGIVDSDSKKIVKDNKILFDRNQNVSIFVDTEKNEAYQINKEEKTYTKFDEQQTIQMVQFVKAFSNMPYISSTLMTNENYFETESYIWLINNMKVVDDVYNNIECYKIYFDMSDLNLNGIIDSTWFDKDTLLPIRDVLEDSNGNILEEHNYSILSGNITEADINLDILSDYTLIQN